LLILKVDRLEVRIQALNTENSLQKQNLISLKSELETEFQSKLDKEVQNLRD